MQTTSRIIVHYNYIAFERLMQDYQQNFEIQMCIDKLIYFDYHEFAGLWNILPKSSVFINIYYSGGLALKHKLINFVFGAAGAVCVIYYLSCGLSYRFDQSMLWVWLAAGIILLARFVIVHISIRRNAPLPYPKWFINTLRYMSLFAAACFLVVECFVFSGFFNTCPQGVDYVILLGAKTGSITIERRIDMAYEYLVDNPETVVICTGGQGSDEEMPEGEYMKRGLVQRGISEDRILVEDRSTSTDENLRFSRKLITDENATIAVVSNNYHIFRAMAIARKYFEGAVYGLPMASNYLSLPHYMVREFFTVVVDGLRGNLAF